MKNKKRISFFLVLILVVSVIPFTASSAETVTVQWNEPAITADTGEAIQLDGIKVQFNEGGTETAVTWKNQGETVTSFTPSQAGVYTLTAESGENVKNIYIVVKNPSDKDYVLYSTDFDSEDDLKDWTLENGKASKYSVKDGILTLNGENEDLIRATLPAWLGEFGNYCIEASVMTSNYKDNSRWNAIMYRIQKNSYPYYQMCVRKDSAASSGVEFALRTPSNTWDVKSNGSHSENQKSGIFYTYEVQVKNNTIMHSIDGRYAVFNEDTKDYKIGTLAVQANYSNMHIDYITVKLQLEKPEVEVADTLVKTKAEVTNIITTVTNAAYINSIEDFDCENSAMNVIISVNESNIIDKNGKTICVLDDLAEYLKSGSIPVFNVKDKASADSVISYIKSKNLIDAAIMSSDGSIVKYARGKSDIVRGIVDFRGKYNGKLTAEDIIDIRLQVNGNLAKTAVIDYNVLNQETTALLQSNLLTVWVSAVGTLDKYAAAALLITGANGVATDCPDTVKEACGLFESNTVTRPSLIIGHRGNPTQAPENSISGYILAIENGANIVETDIYLTKDNEIVIMHDGTIDRTTNGTGNIENMTLAELKEFYVWGDNDSFKSKFPDERIPTLQELFDAVKEHDDYSKIFVEIKSGKNELVPILAKLIRDMDMTERVSVIAFNPDTLKLLQTHMPEMSCGYLMTVSGSAASQGLANFELNKWIKPLLKYNTTLNMSSANLSKCLIQAATDRGITIWPWTYRMSGATMSSSFTDAFFYGVGGLTTDDAQYLKTTPYSIKTVDSVRIAAGEKFKPEIFAYTYGRTNFAVEAEGMILSDANIAEIESDGTIKGLNEGIVKVTYKYKATFPDKKTYWLYSDPIEVTVCAAEDVDVLSPKSYGPKIEGEIVYKVPPNTTVKIFADMFSNEEIRVFKGETQLGASEIIGTGYIVKSYKDGDEKDSKIIAVRGDLNGDGLCDENDTAFILSGGLAAEQQKAADINENGIITTADYLTQLRRFKG